MKKAVSILEDKVVIYSLLNDINSNLGKMDKELEDMGFKLQEMFLAKPIMKEIVP
jgi:hypothetical protein